MSKSVLFVINGFGMGNATRCEALIDLLDKGFEVDVITSDKALLYFTGHPRLRQVKAQLNIQSEKSYRYGTFLFFLKFSWRFTQRLFANYRIQKEQMTQNNYEAIFFDSDYSFILHRLFSNHKKIVGINNAYEVVSFFENNWGIVTPKILVSLIFELLDLSCYQIFSHFIICPSVDPKKLAPVAKTTTIPLLIRSAFFKSDPPPETNANKSILVMSSSSNVESDLNKILPHIKNKNLSTLVNTFEKDNISKLLNSSIIVCNGGQSSLAECLYLNKPALVVNIPHHAEQLSNVLLAEFFGLVPFQEKSLDQINEVLEQLPRPRYTYNYDDLKLQVKDAYKKILNTL
ncbi:MAG: glycosyltransferase [Pseudobdellovibrio sp.]